MATVVAMTRAGINAFWASPTEEVPRVRVAEIAPVLLLLALNVALTVQAAPAMRYMEDTARSLHDPGGYAGTVLSVTRAPGMGGKE